MTTQNPVYASQAKPWLKYYDQKFIDQTLPALSAFEYVCQRSKNHLNDTALEYYGRKFAYARSDRQRKRPPPPCGRRGKKGRHHHGGQHHDPGDHRPVFMPPT